MAMISNEAIKKIGFASCGSNVQISEKASIYGAENIHIGNNVRIDDFCVLSAGVNGIKIGNYIHIAVYSSLIGSGRIELSDFCNLSSRVSIYSSNDDYSGETLTNPMVPAIYKNVAHGEVKLGKHVIVGCGSVILPNTMIGDGAAIGALSFVTKNCDPFYIYAGNPAKKIKERKDDLLKLEKQLIENLK